MPIFIGLHANADGVAPLPTASTRTAGDADGDAAHAAYEREIWWL